MMNFQDAPQIRPEPQPEALGEEILFEPLAKKAQTIYRLGWTPSAHLRLFKAMKERQTRLSLPHFSDYAALLRREGGEWARLWPTAAPAERAFYRPAAQFEVARDLLAEWSVMAPDRTLRVLSLGCGPGFETCSLAMMLEETGLRAKNWQVEIYGLDVNEEAAAKAMAQVFAEEDLDWLTPAQRKKWFTPRGGGWTFKSSLAAPIRVEAGNIYEPETWPWADQGLTFDLIFCRGTSFEAPPAAPRQLARILRQALSPTGFIFTAPGEFLPDESGEMHLEERAGVTYYRRGQKRLKANRRHTPKKRRQGAAAPAQGQDQLPPPTVREAALMEQAAQKIISGRPEKARELLGEIMISQMDRGRPQPEAWRLLADIDNALGRPEPARAALEAAGDI